MAHEHFHARYARLREIARAAGYAMPEHLPAAVRSEGLSLAVVGEFNAGKSTLINALLGEEALPTSLLPTTAVLTILQQGPAGDGHVDHFDGMTLPMAPGDWRALLVEEQSAARIKSVRITHPALPAGLTLLDTPGTNDMSALRTDALYQTLPQADAVLFVIHGATALKATEITFLKERILANDLTKLLFVVNQMDRVDEEEQAEVLEHVAVTLRKVFAAVAADLEAKGGRLLADAVRLASEELLVLPLSARQALRSLVEGSEAKLAQSGLPALKEALARLLAGNAKEQLTTHRLELFLERGIGALRADFARQDELASQDKEQLAREVQQAARGLEEAFLEVRSTHTRVEERLAVLQGSIRSDCRQFFDQLAQQQKPKAGQLEQEVRRFVEGQIGQINGELKAILTEQMGADASVNDLRWSAALTVGEESPKEELSFSGWLTNPLCYALMFPASIFLGPIGLLGVLAWPLVGGLFGRSGPSEEQLAAIRAQVREMGDAASDRLCALTDNLTAAVYGRLLGRLDTDQAKLRTLLEAHGSEEAARRRTDLLAQIGALETEA